MKIVVKHVDNIENKLTTSETLIPQYLVYVMTDDNISISCNICNGDEKKEEVLNKNLTLPVHEVSYEEFKNNNLKHN
jgi:hypothetical protein